MKKLLVLAFSILTCIVKAQQTDSAQVLSEVTIVGIKEKSVPGSGTYLSNQTLQKWNQTSINSVLRAVPGVNVRDEEGFGLRPNIGLRGTSVSRSAKITLMEDGVLIAPAPYADPSAYYFPTFTRLQSIEVLKGCSQIKYGPYTIGGALNLISTSIPSKFKFFAQTSLGSFNNNQQKFLVGNSLKKIDYLFEVNRLASNGFKQLDNGGKTGFDRNDIMGKVRLHLSKKTSSTLTLKFLYTQELSNESYLGLTNNDYINNPYRRYAATQKDALNINHHHFFITHSFNPFKNTSVNTTAYKTHTFRDWSRVNSVGGIGVGAIVNNEISYNTQYQIMTGKADGNIDFQSAERTFNTSGAQTNIQYFISGKTLQHKLELGIRYHQDEADRYSTKSVYAMQGGMMNLTNKSLKGNLENQLRKANSIATYLNYELIYKRVKLTAGIRCENINLDLFNYGTNDANRNGVDLKSASNNIKVLLPGIGVNYDLDNYSNIFANIQKGFSPPGMPSTSVKTTQAISETAINYELGYKLVSPIINTQIVAFVNDYKNILGSDNVSGGGAGTGDMFNAGKAVVKGVEVSATYNVLYKTLNSKKIKLPLTISYTYTHAVFKETFVNAGGDWGSGTINKNDLIPFITPQLLTTSFGIEAVKFNATISYKFVGETRTKPGQGIIITPNSSNKIDDINALESFSSLDFSTNYLLNKNLTIYSTVNNILNNKNIVSSLPQGYRPNMPVNFAIGIKGGL